MSRFGNWWRKKLADAIDRDILGSPTQWCRFRGPDNHCRYPHRLHPMGTATVGWAVWTIEDRGLCHRDQWAEQLTCPSANPANTSADSPPPRHGRTAANEPDRSRRRGYRPGRPTRQPARSSAPALRPAGGQCRAIPTPGSAQGGPPAERSTWCKDRVGEWLPVPGVR